MRSKIKNPWFKNRLVLVSLAIIIFIFVAGIFYLRGHGSKKIDNTVTDPTGTEKVDLNPPTQEDRQIADNHKEELARQQNQQQNQNDTKLVTPTIVSADKNGANAYISGIFEEGGTCTATFTHGNDKITTTSQGFQNANYTSCAPLVLSGPLNIQGQWSVVVSYSSLTAHGSSTPMQIEIK